MQAHKSHEYYMAIALKEAEKGGAEGEVPVGAVIVKDGKVIARARNRPIKLKDPTAHAEILAIRKASRKLKNYRLNGTTLYVTIEPCPMCAGAIVNARIETLVYGAREEKWGADGSVVNLFRNKKFNHKVFIINGIMEKDCKEVMQGFFRKKRKKGGVQ